MNIFGSKMFADAHKRSQRSKEIFFKLFYLNSNDYERIIFLFQKKWIIKSRGLGFKDSFKVRSMVEVMILLNVKRIKVNFMKDLLMNKVFWKKYLSNNG